MSGPAWIIDSKRIATKIKNASGLASSNKLKWISNPTKACPRCNHMIDNSDVLQDWPGLPPGVKFDPSDQELLRHLLAKIGIGDAKPHPFINEFIPTVEEEDGICYTHPKKLPGVKQDGTVSHFFHRTFKAYNTGTRKRRKINTDDLGDVRWHKTGKTKPVHVDGKHLGCKKIMVLYMSTIKGERPEKTNWVMHQYHFGTGEDEKDGEYVVSKVFYQQQAKPGDKNEQNLEMDVKEGDAPELDPAVISKVDSPEDHDDKRSNIHILEQTSDLTNEQHEAGDQENNCQSVTEKLDQDNNPTDDAKWWEGESQYLLDSQQLAEGIAICDEFLQSQTSCDGEVKKASPCLSDYARIGVEHLKKDLEECQNLAEPSNIELDTPSDFRLSQLEFGSQDSFLAWGGSKLAD